jgi:RHS repeat-associated protein
VLTCDTSQFTPTTVYVLSQDGQQLTEMTSSDAGSHWTWAHTNVWAGGQLAATYSTNQGQAALYFQLTDWLGSRRVTTDYAGNPCMTFTNLPYGNSPPPNTVTCLAPAQDPTEHHFTGKERDAETGNDYFGARYYESSMGRFLSPDWSAKIEPVPYSKLEDPQTLNLYDYVRNNPLSNVDADGHACSGVLGNTGSGFCTRATEYGKIDANPTIQSETRFFAAANAVSQGLADVSAWSIGVRIEGVSAQTTNILEGVGQRLEQFNEGAALMIVTGSMSGPGLDQKMVHNEQTIVQGELDKLKQSNPNAYTKTISEINSALNPNNPFKGWLSSRFPTDKAFQGVLNGVRKNLGRNIDFSKQSDREAIGNALIKHIRQTGGCDLNGDRQGECK